jgi:hypothetical protein
LIGIFLVYFAAACANFNFFLTNEFTPGGDGPRIYTYLKYMEKVPETIPLWQAHKHHGYPLLADPENHMPWSLILDTESPNFNIHLNLVFFFLTAIFAFTCRSIARLLEMSQTASFAVGIITILCVPVVRLFMHGTLTIFLAYVLAFIAIFLIMLAATKTKISFLYLLLPASILLGWCLVTSGYYILIYFYIPASVLLMCSYFKEQEQFFVSIRKIALLLVLITVFLVLFSSPVLLPVIDGLIISKTFATKTATINISISSIYNYYLVLWPFIFLALLFSKGLFRRWAILFAAMASINYLLILFEAIHFNAFFDFWRSAPILKNIRWQHLFVEISSISSAFCAGIFIDSCREKFKIHNKWLHFAMIAGFVALLFWVAYIQHSKSIPFFMLVITLIFIAMTIVGNRLKIILPLCFILTVLMVTNFHVSPLGNKLYIAKNINKFRVYKRSYCWNGMYGLDKFSPVFRYGFFSMVFMSEYRLLLSLLYDHEITAQRPHWIFEKEPVKGKIQNRNINKKISQIMAMINPKTKRNPRNPFPVYDHWVIADESEAIELMKQDTFSPEGPIILSQPPGFEIDNSVPLKAYAEITGKTAETLSLHVKTNKNSVVLVPEIYHRDWQAAVDGNKTGVIKAFASMRGIALPPGDHAVTLRFVYQPFIWGNYIAVISFLLAFLLLYFFKNKINYLLPSARHIETDIKTSI